MNYVTDQGSLELYHDEGDDTNPETWTVRFADFASASGEGSLEVARDYFEVNDHRLNGSQVQTVKAWAEEYL